jgi:hypothetical protein
MTKQKNHRKENRSLRTVTYIAEKKELLSAIKVIGKIYYVLESCELWSEMLYNAVVSEGRPEIVDTVTLSGGITWKHRTAPSIFNELRDKLSAKGYKLIFKPKTALHEGLSEFQTEISDGDSFLALQNHTGF